LIVPLAQKAFMRFGILTIVAEKRFFIGQMKIGLPDLDSEFGRTIDSGEDASLAGSWSQGHGGSLRG
jgi:hypothetical protein